MARYYVAQVNDARAGWLDLQDGASLSKKVADDFAEFMAKSYLRATRTIRKPKGWTPSGEFGVTLPYEEI